MTESGRVQLLPRGGLVGSCCSLETDNALWERTAEEGA